MKNISITNQRADISGSILRACARSKSKFANDASEAIPEESSRSPKRRCANLPTIFLRRSMNSEQERSVEFMLATLNERNDLLNSMVEQLGDKLCAIEEQLERIESAVNNLDDFVNKSVLFSTVSRETL